MVGAMGRAHEEAPALWLGLSGDLKRSRCDSNAEPLASEANALSN